MGVAWVPPPASVETVRAGCAKRRDWVRGGSADAGSPMPVNYPRVACKFNP